MGPALGTTYFRKTAVFNNFNFLLSSIRRRFGNVFIPIVRNLTV